MSEEENVERYKKYDPYPWLTIDDPRRSQSDEEILYEKIDLSDSVLSRKEKSRLMKMLIKYRDAFSLRDEIGECPNLKADIKVIDESPFFVRPFPISEKDKPFMDEQMERLVSLGILSKNSTSHTSPVMLITRKMTKDKRPVVDFRLLNTRILRRNTSIPLMSDVLSILGNSECEVGKLMKGFLMGGEICFGAQHLKTFLTLETFPSGVARDIMGLTFAVFSEYFLTNWTGFGSNL